MSPIEISLKEQISAYIQLTDGAVFHALTPCIRWACCPSPGSVDIGIATKDRSVRSPETAERQTPSMTQPQYVPAGNPGTSQGSIGLSTSNNQPMDAGYYQIPPGEQGSVAGPFYVFHPSTSGSYSATPGFMQHRTEMAANVQFQQPRVTNTQTALQPPVSSGFILNTSDLPASGPSTFTAPHPILTPRPSVSLHGKDSQHVSQTKEAAQSSPLPATPYETICQEGSANARQPAAVEQVRGNMSEIHGTPDHSRQGIPPAYVYSQSPHMQTSISVAPASAMYYASPGVNASQGGQPLIQQHHFTGQQTSASRISQPYLAQGLSYQSSAPQYQFVQSLPNLPVAPGIIPTSQRDAAGSRQDYSGQQVSQSIASSFQPSSLQPGMEQYRMEGVPVYATPMQHLQSQSLSAQTTIVTSIPTGVSSATWTHPGIPQKRNSIPAGFSHSHSRNPGFSRGGIIISEEVDAEEYTGNLTYDPYMVRILRSCVEPLSDTNLTYR